MKNVVKATITLAILLLFSVFMVFVTYAQECDNLCRDTSRYENLQGSFRSPLDDQRVLLIGDSQTAGYFGSELLSYVTASGATYYVRAGQSGWGVINWWVNRDNINRLMKRHHPTLVLVELGGNDWQRSRSPAYVRHVSQFWHYVQQQAEENKLPGKTVSYCWIAPARAVGRSESHQSGRSHAAEAIHNVVGDTHYVESNDITGSYGRTPDGIHFTRAGAHDWAQRVISRIEDCTQKQLTGEM